MAPDTFGTIFNINRYAIHDGAGIRTTVFFKGCPIRCHWCSNPESQKTAFELSYLKSECILCGRCVESCPQNAIRLSENVHSIDRKACNLCGECVLPCPSGALEITGRTISARELYGEVSTDRPFWERSHGGVTISGGEPLVQPAFAKAFLNICQDNYVHTAIETCLHVPQDSLQGILPFVDQVICDLKIMDDTLHKKFTGGSNSLILKNIATLLATDKEVLVRMPLLPGVNDDENNLRAVGTFIESHREGTQFELLPYHQMGEAKYERLGRSYKMTTMSPPSKKSMSQAISILKKFNIGLVNTKQ